MGKKVRVKESTSCLPHEVIFFNILNRLPVETLLGFCSVSKLWHRTIHDPEFVRSLMNQEHEMHLSFVNALFKVKKMDPKQRGFDYIFSHKGLEFLRIHTSKWTCRVGDCNGLYCFRSRSGFEICNPSTQEFLYHPFPPSPPPRCLKSYGFGFDPLKKEYKVVQVVHGNLAARCMVYTLGTDSWKDITVKSSLPNYSSHSCFTGLDGPAGMVNPDRGLYLNGALHWYFRRANMVMRFDLHKETFSLIRVCFLCPWDSMHTYSCFLTEWHGRLGLVFQTPRARSLVIYKYMLKEHDLPDFGPEHEGVRPAIRVWEKLIVELPRPPCSKVGVMSGGEALYWFTAQRHLSFYHPDDCGHWQSFSGSESAFKFALPLGVKYASLCEYKFSHRITNPFSLKKFAPAALGLIRCTKGENMAQVKSVSSL